MNDSDVPPIDPPTHDTPAPESEGRLTRRQVLAAGTAAGLIAASTACGVSASGDTDTDANETGEDGGSAVPIPAGMSAVAIVHRDDTEESVRRAIDLAGGIEEIEAGQSVFIKVNAVHHLSTKPAIVTSVAVMTAVIKLLRERDVGTIVVGDRSSRPFASSVVFTQTGLRQAALDAGADEVYAAPRPSDDPDAWSLEQPPGWEEVWAAVGGVQVMRKAVEADHIINIPVCKNHRWAGFSMAMKNWIGGIGDDSRDEMHYQMSMPEDLSRAIAILNQLFRPTMNIVDALSAVINGGPEGFLSDAVHVTPGLILASKDPVALDATGAALLKLELDRTDVPEPDALHAYLMSTGVWAMPQIVHGIERGLGRANRDDVELRFDDVADDAGIETIFRA